ncbi:hypothetical protein FRC05_007094 [Tulasnella sp. 425]|nr:hypothetical protein FRC05_007094 [Tulasnella sp. 425]
MGLRQSKPQYFDLDHELSAPLRSTLKDVEHLFIRPRRLKITAGNQVGVGGYGEVMLATLDKSRNVAVKQLRARLARELKIWATLQHPNILGLLGYYLSKNYEIAQLISVYMVNGNVSQYLNQNQPDITTRLKLANVLISDELDAVICDLGVASFINEAEGPSGLTTTRAVKGSSRYMSPELLLEGEGKQTLASDIWAWACTTYEIFTNIEPYSEVKTNGHNVADKAVWGNQRLLELRFEQTPLRNYANQSNQLPIK